MHNLSDMVWIELRKAFRSRMPLWTALGSLFMPLGISFLIWIARNPAISQTLGLIGAKANLVTYAAIEWAEYLSLFGMLIAAGGFFLYILIISWVFGREFTDGTLKDILAVPVPRGNIVLAKYIVATAWCAALSILIFVVGLAMGAVIQLPGVSTRVIVQHSLLVLVTACLVMAGVTPFALFASIGRGYLLPLGLMVLTLMSTNLVAILGWGEYFPWAVPALYVQAKGVLPPVSFVMVFLTGLAGIFATVLWWKYADQNR